MDRAVVTSESVPRFTSPLPPTIRAGDYPLSCVLGQVGANPAAI
jgi:hypothetical protein